MTSEIGHLLRKARIKRAISLRGLAAELGLSPSLISQVETGKTQPSVSTLYALSTFLGLSVDELLSNETSTRGTDSESLLLNARHHAHHPALQRGNDNPRLEMDNGVTWERLAISDEGSTEPILATYSPGASSSIEGKLMRHGGHEHAYLLEGNLTVHLEFETFELTPGDSLQFDALRPHMYVNHGTVRARGLWHVVGRRQQTQGLPVASASPRNLAQRKTREINSAVDVLKAMENVSSN